MTPPSIKEALEHYAHEYCEGWCEQDAGCANFDDCVGCLARRALATLKPSGERREAIARIIEPHSNLFVDPTELASWNEALAKADQILASGLVQDEAAIRADEREKCELRIEELDCMYVNGVRHPYGGIPADPESSVYRDAIKAACAAIRSARDGGAS